MLTYYKFHNRDGDKYGYKRQNGKELLRVDLYSENAVSIVLYVFEDSAADKRCSKSANTAYEVLYGKSLGDVLGIYVAVYDIEGVLVQTRDGYCVEYRISGYKESGGWRCEYDTQKA